MLSRIVIKNFKSIEDLTIDLGQVNVIIGENGAGKSNILEAIAIAGAAQAEKLDNEFLAARGIRVTNPRFMRSALDAQNLDSNITIEVTGDEGPPITYRLTNDNQPYSSWSVSASSGRPFDPEKFNANLTRFLDSLPGKKRDEFVTSVIKAFREAIEEQERVARTNTDLAKASGSHTIELPDGFRGFATVLLESRGQSPDDFSRLSSFVIYSPENSALRTFEREGQIEPLGINGEGLLKLLTVMTSSEPAGLQSVKQSLALLGWFQDFELPSGSQEGKMYIRDVYLDDGLPPLDQQSANEGFLFLTFYFALFASELTPRFFAVDNVDASLNPKLCEELIRTLTRLAKQHNKQAIFTAHNPAVLDGLNLDDESQRLFVVSRGHRGQTKLRRILKPKAKDGAIPIRLSEAFLRGALGGLPKSF